MPLSTSYICQKYADEVTLTKALQIGENEAFGCLFESFKDLIKQMCQKFPKVGDENIKDLYTESIIAIFGLLQKPDKAEKEHNLGGVVNRTFFFKINEFLRNNSKFVKPYDTNQASDTDIFDSSNDDESDEDYFGGIFENDDDEQLRIEQAIKKTFDSNELSEDCKRLVKMKEMGGASYDELATDLNKSAASLKSNYGRCKSKFQEVLRYYLNI